MLVACVLALIRTPLHRGTLDMLTEWLSLADNFLSGNVPSELGNIFTLSEVYLHFNDLEGDVPEQICELRPTAIGESDETTGLIEFWNDCGDDPPQVSCPENCCTRCFSAEDAETSYSPTYEPTVIPTMNPTVDDVPALLENDDLRLFLIEHMDGFEDSLSTENIGTAQYEAYLWLANSNNLDELDVFQRVQRYVGFIFGFVSDEKYCALLTILWVFQLWIGCVLLKYYCGV